MTLLGKPVPPLDHEPSPFGAPPGIAVDLDYYKRWANEHTLTNDAWWPSRPVIKPIGAVIHTNAASVEASIESAKAHGNRGIYNTKPHYNFNAPVPEKNVPTDRRSIANSTGSSIEYQYGCPDASFWLLAFETADAGGNKAVNGDYGDFLYNHDELIARALAYESIWGGWELRVPSVFYTPGVYTHTEPWPYPYLTTKRGKTCPTQTKKDRVLRGDIIPRAIEIKNAWTAVAPPTPPPSEGDTMFKRSWPNRIDSRHSKYHTTLKNGELRSVWISSASVGMTDPSIVDVNVTVIPKDRSKAGYLAIWPGGDFTPAKGNVKTLNFSAGTTAIANSMLVPVDKNGNVLIKGVGCDMDFVIDISGVYE